MDKYKKTSLNFNKDVETRKLRAFRRSVDRSNIKHIRLSALRHIDPFEENLEDSVFETEKIEKKNTIPIAKTEKPCNKPVSRLEMLKKWKEEKELKKKLAKQQAKPAFVLSKAPTSSIPPRVPYKNKNSSHISGTSTVRAQILPPKSITKQNQATSNLPRMNSSTQVKRDVQPVQRSVLQAKGTVQPAQRSIPQVKSNLQPQKNVSTLPQRNGANVSSVPKVNCSKGGLNCLGSSKLTTPRNNVTASALKIIPQTKGCPNTSNKKLPQAKNEDNKQNGARTFVPSNLKCSSNIGSSKLAVAKNNVTSSSKVIPQSKGCSLTSSNVKVSQAKDENKDNKQSGATSFAPSNFKFKPPLSLQEIFFKSCQPSKPVAALEKSFRFTPAKFGTRTKTTPKVTSSKKKFGVDSKLSSSVSIPPKPVFEEEEEASEQQNSEAESVPDKDESSVLPVPSSPNSCKEELTDEPAPVEPEQTEIKSSETQLDAPDEEQNKSPPVLSEPTTTEVPDDVPTEEKPNPTSKVFNIPLSELNDLDSPGAVHTPRRSRRLASLQKQMEHLVLTPENSQASECSENQTPVESTKSDNPLTITDTDAYIIQKKISEEKTDIKKERKSLKPRQSTACKPNMTPIIEGIEAVTDGEPKNGLLDTPKPMTRQQRKISLLGSPQIPYHGSRKSVKGDLITFSPIM